MPWRPDSRRTSAWIARPSWNVSSRSPKTPARSISGKSLPERQIRRSARIRCRIVQVHRSSVATDFDRDDGLHGLLRDTLRSQPVSGPCIDAATLAAWAEDALTPEETAATDAHLAACARCRELAATLLTMAETEDAPAA